MKAVLVTGSRHWTDKVTIAEAIYGSERTKPQLVIHGDAPGADRLAGEVARDWRMSELSMPAQWDRDGRRAAGPIRNQHMVNVARSLVACGWDVEVHAFPLPDSKGTLDCIERARKAGLVVHVHKPE